MADNPLVSVLVPVYGVENYIERCARSLFEQTLENIEFIFVNDCTKDNSIAVLEKVIEDYPNRNDQIRIIHHEKNKGLAGTRNTALDNSLGMYIMIVDSDDWLIDKYVIEKLVNHIESTNSDIVVFDFVNVYKNTTIVSHKNIPFDRYDYLKYVIECKCTPSLATSFYKASLFKDNNVRNIESINIGEDYTVQPKLIYYAKKISYLKEPLYCYFRANENSYINTYSGKNGQNSPELDAIETFFSTKDEYSDLKQSLEAARFHKITRNVIAWAKYSGKEKNFPKFRIKSIKYWINSRFSLTYKFILLSVQLHLQYLLRFFVKKWMNKLYNEK